MNVNFYNNCSKIYDEYKKYFINLANITFKKLKINQNYLIDLTLVKSNKIRTINKNNRNIDKVTDVLSFAFLELKGKEVKITGNCPIMLGEIYICPKRIRSQAKEFNTTFEYELGYIFVHGVLHLLGYDHVHNEKEAKIMFNLQEEILKEYN